MCASFLLNAILRSEGESGLSMVSHLIGGAVNVILDPILILKLDMGTSGAAIATVFSQFVSLVIMAVFFINGRSNVRLSVKLISGKFSIYKRIILTGIPTICRQSLGSISFALLNRKAALFGDAAVAAVTIANKVYTLVRGTTLGIGQGFQPIAGYNFGAGEKKRTGKSFIWACIYGSIICCSASIIIGAFPSQIIGWFRDDPEVIKIGVESLKYLCLSMPVLGYSTFVNQLYQSLGFKTQATLLACCRQGIFFIPSLYILIHFFGIVGIEATQMVGDLMTFVISIPFQIWFFRKILKYKEA